MKKLSKSFAYCLREYLTVYLPKQRNCSRHTITATKQTWNMLLTHICFGTGRRVESVSFEDLNKQALMNFLDEHEMAKGWLPSTRNHRLACIRSFFRYAASLEPTLVIYYDGIKGIPLKKGVDKSRVVDFLSPEAMGTVLRQPDVSTKMGIRDTFFMMLMYDWAARDCEMLSMRFCDIDADKKTVYLLGKGNKPRLVPISEDTVCHFQRYAKLYHSANDGTSLMFYTVHRNAKTPMSDDNVARFLRKYGEKARVSCPEVPENIHPHLIRATRAMHLYRSGMPLPLLSEWLGHEDPLTTLIYARADTEMKRKAIEQAESKASTSVRPAAETVAIWEGNEDMIKRLCGLV